MPGTEANGRPADESHPAKLAKRDETYCGL